MSPAGAAPACPAPGEVLPGCTLHLSHDLDALQARWHWLLARAGAYVFQTWEWNRHWQATVGAAQGVQPRIVECRDAQGRSIALWPLALYRRQGLRVLDFLGEVVSDYRAPLLDAEVFGPMPPQAYARLWREVLRAAGPADLVDLRRMPQRLDAPGQAGRQVDNPMAALPHARHTENAHAATLPDTVEALQARVPARRQADMRRLMRQLQQQGQVVLTPSHDADSAGPVMQALARQKSRRWQASGSRDLYAEPGYLDFYAGLRIEARTGARVCLSSLKVDEQIVATHWGAAYRGRYYWLVPTYEAGRWARYACGRALQYAMMQAGVQAGLRVFDLTVGDEAYKKDWSDHSLALYSWAMPMTLRGRLALARRRARDWARRQPLLRALAQRLRAAGGRPAA
ncbi:GNAT family N-acetyltransferase [Orrella sp. JC864]|uniref:GNAT family N-acetyltransferase n=1 Tax=Orrella sp. JC864 TaxID=3120298 RepID=UPI00300B686F